MFAHQPVPPEGGKDPPRVVWLAMGLVFVGFCVYLGRGEADVAAPHEGLLEVPFFATIALWCFLMFLGVVHEASFRWWAIAASLGLALLFAWAVDTTDGRRAQSITQEVMVDRNVETDTRGKGPVRHHEVVVIQGAPNAPAYFVRSFELWELMADRTPREVLVSRTPLLGRVSRVELVDRSRAVEIDPHTGVNLAFAGVMFAAAAVMILWERRERLGTFWQSRW